MDEILHKSILVIDDEEELRHNIAKILKILGFNVIEAEDGEKGYEAILNNALDLVVSDIKMPVMDGYELLTKVRENDVKKYLPFIFLTSNIDREQMRRGMVLGADDYITKPFTTEELALAIKTRLERAGVYNEYYDEKFSKIITDLKGKAYVDNKTGLPNLVSLKEMLTKMVQNRFNFLLVLFEIDGATELSNFLSVKSYQSIIMSIADKLHNKPEQKSNVYVLSDNEMAVLYDAGVEQIEREFIDAKINELKEILNTPVAADDIELSFTSSGGVYRSDNETNIDEILHNTRIAKTFSQKAGGGNFTLFSPLIKEKYSTLSSSSVKKHLHVMKKSDFQKEGGVVDNFETKVFFLYPQTAIQGELVNEIVRNEYSAFILNDHIKALKLLKKYTNSIVFINIDSVLSEPEWEEYTRVIMTNPEYEGVRIGILSYHDDRGKAEKYLMKLMVPCGFIKLKSGLQDSLSIILRVLEANEAKGKRKYVRVKVDEGENTFMDARIDGKIYRSSVIDLSSIGLSVVFHDELILRDSTNIDEMIVSVRGVIIHTRGKIMGTRPYNGQKLYVVLFDKDMDARDRDKIHSYIFKTKQEQLDSELRTL